jgi:hypothetical protein
MHYRGRNELHERSSEREREILEKMELTRGTARLRKKQKARNFNDVYVKGSSTI